MSNLAALKAPFLPFRALTVRSLPNCIRGSPSVGTAPSLHRLYQHRRAGSVAIRCKASENPRGVPASASEAPKSFYPTFIPRPANIPDGEWSSVDQEGVKKALQDAGGLPSTTEGPLSDQKVARCRDANALLGRNVEELEELAEQTGQPKYRGKQLHNWIYKHKCRDIMAIDQLPMAWRKQLVDLGTFVGRAEVVDTKEARDGTVKFLLRLAGGNIVEAVGIPSFDSTRQRLTVCVSSQVGCPMRCTFCATGKGGFARNLKVHEIVNQVLEVESFFGKRVSNVVFMGMGEPLLNLPAVTLALRTLNEDVGIGARMMTVSTVGVPNAIQALARMQLQSTLAVSLHAPNQAIRESIIPSAKAYPYDALLSDCREYFRITGRRVSFEYTLLAGVNDAPAHAKELCSLLKKMRVQSHVNVIPYNPVSDAEFVRPSNAAVSWKTTHGASNRP
eukprot:jgi/Mesvir1/27183/Mv07761-RA.1